MLLIQYDLSSLFMSEPVDCSTAVAKANESAKEKSSTMITKNNSTTKASSSVRYNRIFKKTSQVNTQHVHGIADVLPPYKLYL